MAKKQTPKPTVTFNNKSYNVEDLPIDVRELVGIHQDWNNQLLNQRREVFKLEAALRGLMAEMELRFKALETKPDAP